MFEIYFNELNKETQQALLKYAHLNSPEEANWDVLPIALISLFDVEEAKNDNGSIC